MPERNESLELLLTEATQMERKNLVKARVLAEEALRRCQAENYSSGSVYALRLLGGIDLQQGKREEAAAFLEQGLVLARSLGDAALISACLYTQGHLFYMAGALSEAVLNFHEVVTLRLSLGLETPLAHAYNVLGVVYRELGNYDQALSYHSKSREIHRAQKDVFGEATSLNNLGSLEGDRKHYAGALRYYQESLVCAQKVQDLSSEVSAFYNIAHTHVLMEQPKKAVVFARQARRGARALGNPGQLLNVRLLDGIVYCALGRFPRAERSLLWALSQTRDLQDPRMELRVLNELGNLYLNWKRPEEAQRHLESCLKLGEAMQANLQLTTCHEYLVEAMEQQQNFECALFHHREFYRLERQRFDRETDQQRLALRMSLDIERTEREAVAQQERNAELEELTRRDSMTGLYNHRAFHEFLAEYLAEGEPLALLLLDVDHFKSYNDAFGHPAGDEVLQQLAQLLQESIRKSDTAARYGGEEFAIILRGEPAESAYESALRLVRVVREAKFPHRKITLSIGVALATVGITTVQLVAKADAALYQAKHAGRDCCEYAA
ncbi:MAG: diguanylate cyclase [Armatimonadetes bacterium]|nr:diguanylate cyclase [Armatimonadota bacterium]